MDDVNAAANAAASVMPLSQIAMTGGFGVVAGYAIGIALKKVFIFTMFFLGIILFAVIALQYYGFVGAVNWDAISAAFDGFASGLRTGLKNLFEFAIAQIPGALGGTAGLIAAWRMH